MSKRWGTMTAQQAYDYASKRGGYAGYALIDQGVGWIVCYDHGEAHPLDFPCKACLRGEPTRLRPKNHPDSIAALTQKEEQG